MTTAAQEVLAILQANGIRRVFGNPGTTELPLLDGMVGAGIPFHLGLHEGIATAMADGYGRVTGTTGVVLVHTAVGTANTAMNLMNARNDRSPVLVIAGEKDDRLTGRESFAEVPDICGLLRQVTKAAWRVTRPEKFPELTYRALNLAQMAPSGPVFLAVPENYMAEAMPAGAESYVRPVVRPIHRPHPDDLRAVLGRLATAERPLILAGNEVGAAGASELLRELAEQLAVPVVSEECFTTNTTSFPTGHPYYHGNFLPQLPVVAEADLIVSFGARMFMEYSFPETPYLRAGVSLIQIGSDPGEFGKIYATEQAIQADVGAALAGMREIMAAQGPGLPAERLQLRQTRARRAAVDAPRTALTPTAMPPVPGTMHLGDLIDGLQAALPADGIVVEEAVLSGFLLHRRFPFARSGSYYGTAGAGLGWGIPAAMGIQLGAPDRRVAAFVGDGGAMFSIQGLWSAARYRLPVVFVVVNNGGYMAVRRGLGQYGQAAVQAGEYPGAWLDEPGVDFAQLAAGLGVRSLTTGNAGDVADVLRQAFALEEPVVVDVRINPAEYY